MTAQLDLFNEAPKANRPTLRPADLTGASVVRTEYGVFDLLQVNSDRTVTIRGYSRVAIPFSQIEGIVR